MPIIDFSNIEYHNIILSEETISDIVLTKQNVIVKLAPS
jgi:hypothetical protein